MAINLDTLEQKLNFRFTDQNLALRALTHRSAGKHHNERLEFLGDSLLGYITAELLYELYPDASEGDLSRMRASMVNKEALAGIARELELGGFIQLGTGELKSGGKDRDSILADALEAIIAAIYLDGGITPCTEFIHRQSKKHLLEQGEQRQQKDSKTRLQELMQAQSLALPVYEVVAIKGEAHEQEFHVECKVVGIADKLLGIGKSKRVAEQEAAQKVLLALGEIS